MILVDDRAGSKQFVDLFPPGVQSVHARLDSADFAWVGNGQGGSVLVGVELKNVTEALQCMTSGRLAWTQLPAMMEEYQVRYLVIQGLWRSEPRTGAMQVRVGKKWERVRWGGGKRAGDFEAWLTTLEELSGTRLRMTAGERHTARVVAGLYRWWSSKRWGEHKSLSMFDRSGEPALLVGRTLTRRVAAQLPGIGWVRSMAVADHFESVFEMMLADEKEWMGVDGVGKITARKVVGEIRGE